MIYAVYDQEFRKSELLKRPKLYSKGMRENGLSWSKYFYALLEAVLHGALIFFIAYIYFDGALSDHGKTNDMRSDGNLCYASVVFAVTLKILFDSNTINALVVMFSMLSVGAYFFFVGIMGLFVKLDIYD